MSTSENNPNKELPSEGKSLEEGNSNSILESVRQLNVDGNDIPSDDEDGGAWYFESVHAALKNNSDYIKLLKTLAILEAQRIQSLRDLDNLRKLKAKALEDPLAFAQRLQTGEDMGFPAPMKIAEVPHIDWSRYNRYPANASKKGRPQTRSARKTSTKPATDPEPVLMPPVAPEMTLKVDDPSSKILVRGRLFDNSKPVTFNQLWTAEEQGRLEELLMEFPTEEVEQNRYRKIAAALGNRTPKQVASRIQKYFLKLHRAGLPVPGRVPRAKPGESRAVRRHQRHNTWRYRPSTFFPSRLPCMDEFEAGDNCTYLSADGQPRPYQREEPEGEEAEGEGDESEGEDDDEDSTMQIPEKVERLRSARVVALLRRVRQAKREADQDVEHAAFKCSVCKEEPICGTRWHCTTCAARSVDFCSDCVVSQLESAFPHPLSHHLEPIASVLAGDTLYDPDYAPKVFQRRAGEYNYLDPNFMPS